MLTQDDTMQYPADNSAPRARARQRGTSLVEVLVVLVILVLGIFSIARLFPGGFFTIRSAENNTFADRLAQSQLETLKQNSAFLLDGVYVFNPSGTTNGLSGSLDPNVNLADLNNDYLPSDPTYNDINKARYVKGELFTVPAVGAAGLPTHILNYGPIALPATANSLAAPSVTSGPWAAQTGSSLSSPSDLSRRVDDPADLLQNAKPNYLVDYGNGRIAVPPAAYAQTFLLQLQSNGNAYTIPLNVPATGTGSSNYNGGWFDPTIAYTTPAGITNATTGVVVTNVPLPWTPGTTSLVRPLQSVSSISPTALPADPYEFTVPAASLVSSAVGLGVLQFDPRLIGQQMSASYLVDDWHIIHEDIDVPAINTTFGTDTSVSNAPIRLTLNHLRRVGDVLPDQTVSPGLFPGATSPADIVLLDTDTGQMQNLSATDTNTVFDADNSTGSAPNTQFVVSYQNGRITLPTNPTSFTGSHKHLRVFYEGDYGWAVALQKNKGLYAPGSFGALGVGQYARDPASPTHLVFPASDLGQSVAVDRISYTDKTGAVQQVATASGAITTDFAGTNYVDLSPFLNNVDPAKPITVGPVRGISARAVVIWKERDQWKSRTVSTILNRS